MTSLRTHLYFLEFEYQASPDECDITLVAQLSMDRLQMVEMLCEYWDGKLHILRIINKCGKTNATFYCNDDFHYNKKLNQVHKLLSNFL